MLSVADADGKMSVEVGVVVEERERMRLAIGGKPKLGWSSCQACQAELAVAFAGFGGRRLMKKTLAAGWSAKDAWIWQLASGRDGQRPCGMASWEWMGMDGRGRGHGHGQRTKWIGPFVLGRCWLGPSGFA